MVKVTKDNVKSQPPGKVSVDGVKHLYLFTKPSGAQSWVFRYRRYGKSVDLGLGPTSVVTLKDATGKALQLQLDLINGRDPKADRANAQAVARAAARQHMLFGKVVDEYFSNKAAGMSAAVLSDWRGSVQNHCGRLLSKPTADIAHADIVAVIEPIWASKNALAKKLIQRLHAIFTWAEHSDYVSGNPVEPVKLRQVLPAVSVQTKHQPSAQLADMPALFAAAGAVGTLPGKALQLVMLTAVRPGEAAGARWSEIDGDLWTLPAERMKSRKEHMVPLSPAALALIAELPQDSEFLFPSREGTAINTSRMTKLMRQLADGMTSVEGPRPVVHGFRSTFSTWAYNTEAARPDTIEGVLAHANGDSVARSCNKAEKLAQRRELLTRYAAIFSGRE